MRVPKPTLRETPFYHSERGEGRLKVYLSAWHVGQDVLVCIYNENAHIGAVAVAEYDHENKRTSTSVFTRLGHKDDAVARKTAYSISRSTRKPVCAIAGIHLDNITDIETSVILENTASLADEFITFKLGEGEG